MLNCFEHQKTAVPTYLRVKLIAVEPFVNSLRPAKLVDYLEAARSFRIGDSRFHAQRIASLPDVELALLSCLSVRLAPVSGEIGNRLAGRRNSK